MVVVFLLLDLLLEQLDVLPVSLLKLLDFVKELLVLLFQLFNRPDHYFPQVMFFSILECFLNSRLDFPLAIFAVFSDLLKLCGELLVLLLVLELELFLSYPFGLRFV